MLFSHLLDPTNLVMLYLLVVVVAAVLLGRGPAMLASTTLLVPQDQLTRVGGMNQALQGVLRIGAPPLGAALFYLAIAARPKRCQNLGRIDGGLLQAAQHICDTRFIIKPGR